MRRRDVSLLLAPASAPQAMQACRSISTVWTAAHFEVPMPAPHGPLSQQTCNLLIRARASLLAVALRTLHHTPHVTSSPS